MFRGASETIENVKGLNAICISAGYFEYRLPPRGTLSVYVYPRF